MAFRPVSNRYLVSLSLTFLNRLITLIGISLHNQTSLPQYCYADTKCIDYLKTKVKKSALNWRFLQFEVIKQSKKASLTFVTLINDINAKYIHTNTKLTNYTSLQCEKQMALQN